MSDSVAEILERLARVEAALGGPPRSDDPGWNLDRRPPSKRLAVKPFSTGPPPPIDVELEAQDRRLSTAAVAIRYGVVVRTVERWLERSELNFPKPEIVNRRKYWWLSGLQKWDQGIRKA